MRRQFIKYMALVLAFVLVAGALPVVAAGQTGADTIPLSDGIINTSIRNLVSITTPPAISVARVHALHDFWRLPERVDIIVYPENTSATASVSWGPTMGFDSADEGAQTATATGTVTLPPNITNTNNIPLTVTVTINIDAAPILIRIIPPEPSTMTHEEAVRGWDFSLVRIPLELYPEPEFTRSVITTVYWEDIQGFDPANPAAQTATIPGEIPLSMDISNINNVPLTFELVINIEAAYPPTPPTPPTPPILPPTVPVGPTVPMEPPTLPAPPRQTPQPTPQPVPPTDDTRIPPPADDGCFSDARVHLVMHVGSYLVFGLTYNARVITMDVAPVIIDNRTMVPVRFIAQAFGATTSWNADAREVTLTYEGETLTMPIGEITPQLAMMGMDVPPLIVDRRTMVPLRFIAEFFGATVTWNPDERSIEIVKM